MEKTLCWFEEKHILGTMTSQGDPHYPLHDDNDDDGNNDQQNQQQLLHLVRWGFSGKKLGWLEEKHILGTMTSPGDPDHPLHDDNT